MEILSLVFGASFPSKRALLTAVADYADKSGCQYITAANRNTDRPSSVRASTPSMRRLNVNFMYMRLHAVSCLS